MNDLEKVEVELAARRVARETDNSEIHDAFHAFANHIQAWLWEPGDMEAPTEVKTMKPASEVAAQLWCKPAHEKKVMDTELCLDVAQAITEARREGMEEAAKVAAHVPNLAHPSEYADAIRAKAKEMTDEKS